MYGPDARTEREISRRLVFLFDKLQGVRVDAEPEACRLGTIGKYVPEVAVASLAKDLDPIHVVARVFSVPKAFFGIVRLEETRPTRPRIKFIIRPEQREITPGADVVTRLLVVVEDAAKRGLGTVGPKNFVLFFRKFLLPRLV